MEVTRIADGLWRWSTYYGEWREAVGSVYVEGDDAVVLVDPLVPEERDEAGRFWRALDRDVKRAGARVHVLVTVFWHVRSAAAVARRYRGRIHAAARARAPVERRAGLRTTVFRPGDRLPASIEALPSGRATEVVFWLPAHAALVPGDVLLGDGAGGIRLCPESWLPTGVGHADLREALAPLLELPVDRVLVSHGEPVLENGREAIARALAA
ncbi:MAG TPA: MBL fold metallo-hydrolase [Gaiella sp.]|jgi:glyoxylase-like metal-dependent hydrolase (beta-lactamase superfamily II)|nr:MBL fold metallo-hydrolase [Gaiella sp.]